MKNLFSRHQYSQRSIIILIFKGNNSTFLKNTLIVFIRNRMEYFENYEILMLRNKRIKSKKSINLSKKIIKQKK